MRLNIRYILFVFIVVSLVSCRKTGLETEAYMDAVSQVNVDWGADRQAVYDFMDGCELKGEGRDYMDFYLPDHDYVVTYIFDDDKLFASALIVPDYLSVSFSQVFKKHVYVGMTVIFNPDVNHADLYADKRRNLMLASYKEDSGGESYRVLAFSPLAK